MSQNFLPSASRVSRLPVLFLLLPLCNALHPTNSAINVASYGLRLREGAKVQYSALPATLSLRGGGEVPGVSWSQRQDSLMLRVEIPTGASHEGLHLAGDGDLLEWTDDKVSLSLGLYAGLDAGSLVKTDGGRQVTLTAKKVTPEWWPKLTKGPKPGNVKVDWASWKDEDEAETEIFSNTKPGMDDDFDFGSMGAGGDGADMDDMGAPPADNADAPKKWVNMDDDDSQDEEAGNDEDDRIEELPNA